ncbi:MAG TPA: hypothetical protein ENJ18_04250, partial [Nannocystis exedens]|nr:hypothetical protein [Nannocystis exedens]
AFDIRYYITDENGARGRQMTANDMLYFVNQARCECGQKIDTQIRLLNTGQTYDQILIDSFVGTQCATAENGISQQYKPCIEFPSLQTNSYYAGKSLSFSPIWLVSGIAGLTNLDDVPARHPDVATPAGSCSGPVGEAGVWLCGQTDGDAGCLGDEFFITGTQNKNITDGESKGITADFQGPLSLPAESSLKAAVGDSAVEVSWDLPFGGSDAYGFRVLCEEADTGEPALSGLVTASQRNNAIAANTYGSLYYTKENLCPDGPFWEAQGSGDGTTTDGTTTDGTTTGTDTDTDTDGTTGTAEPVSAGCPSERPATGMCSLKWDYVCSAHLANNTTSTRIEGLENGKKYNFLLVAYDQAGNPVSAGKVDGITPVETNDLWEQCEADGDACGRSGFCNVNTDAPSRGGFSLVFAFGLLAAGRRRTRKIA